MLQYIINCHLDNNQLLMVVVCGGDMVDGSTTRVVMVYNLHSSSLLLLVGLLDIVILHIYKIAFCFLLTQ
jgi:hypothetical protein